MPTWSMTFSGSDFTAIDVLNMLKVALWERELALYVGSYTAEPLVVAGDDVQSADFWATLQGRAEDLFLGTTGVRWVKDGFDIDGEAYARPHDASSYLVDMDAVFASIDDVFESLSLDGWTRKRPREITGTNVLFDTQGNPIADGDVAFCLSDSSIRIYDAAEDTYFYADPGVNPDVLTSSAGVERTIEDNGTLQDQFGHAASGGQRARAESDGLVYTFIDGSWQIDEEEPDAEPDRLPDPAFGLVCGRVVSGDYIGSWLLTDVRDVINATGNRTTAAVTTGDGDGSGAENDFFIDPIHSFTAAKTSLAANWSAGVGIGGSPEEYAYTRFRRTNYTPDHPPYFWTETIATAWAGVSSRKNRISANDHRSRTGKVYGAFIASHGSGGIFGPTGDVQTYDGQGRTSAAEETWGELCDVTWTTGTTSSWGQLFTDISTQPTNFPSDIPIPDPQPSGVWELLAAKGFAVENRIGLVEWDFTWM